MITITITIEQKPTGVQVGAHAQGTPESPKEALEAVEIMQLLVDRSEAGMLAGTVKSAVTFDPHHVIKQS